VNTNSDTPKSGLLVQLDVFMSDVTLGSAVFSGEDALGPDDSNKFFRKVEQLIDAGTATKEIWDEGAKVRVIKTQQPATAKPEMSPVEDEEGNTADE